MIDKIYDYLSKIDNLAKLEPSSMPPQVLSEFLQLQAEEFYEICVKCAILRHNIPSDSKILNLQKDEIDSLAQDFAKEVILALKSKING